MTAATPARRTLGALPDVTLAAVTVAAVVGMGRLFGDWSFFWPVTIGAVASHVVAALTRRAGLGPVLGALVSTAAVVLVATWVVLPHTTAAGVPTGDTWSVASSDLREAWRVFGRAVAPVEVTRGFVLASFLATWYAAFLADWAAFRIGASFESLVPSFTLFTFSAALGAGGGRASYAGLWLAAVLAFLLLHAADRRASTTAWFATRSGGGPVALVRPGLAIGTATVAVALVAGPLIPGAGDPPMLDWRNDSNTGPRVTVSPLVDIRGRLVQQADVEVFTVRSPAPAYWRLTSLDSFNGTIWGSHGSYRTARGRLRGDGPTPPEVRTVEQEFTISGLDTPWLPAAYRVERYAGADGMPRVSFDRDSGSLLTEASAATGMRYRVRSSVGGPTAAALQGAAGESPDDVLERYTTLPADVPSEVRALARDVTAGATTTYERSRRLQDWFRQNFTYDLEFRTGHDGPAILQFLREQRGYCEQFAGTFAVMARALGIPARVAVGFTPGVRDAEGRYVVTGKQAHAWPEVFVAGYGWVAFEPTPGRGMPGAERYTGVEPQQDEGGPAPAPVDTAPAPTTTVAGGGPTASTPRTLPEDEVSTGDLPTFDSPGSPWPRRLVTLLAVVAAMALLWVVGLPLAWWLRRRRRRAGARAPSDRVLVAWAEVGDALALAGHPRRRSETNREYAVRAAGDDERVGGIATAVDEAGFAPGGLDDDAAAAVVAEAERVVADVHRRVGARRRAVRLLDPRVFASRTNRRA